jgi:hypothetical protein
MLMVNTVPRPDRQWTAAVSAKLRIVSNLFSEKPLKNRLDQRAVDSETRNIALFFSSPPN